MGSSGYIEVACKDKKGKVRHILAHRLVWLALKGKIPNKMMINHKNGIKSDNRLKNLELATVSENNQHAIDNGLHVMTNSTKEKLRAANIGGNSPCAKFTDAYVRRMREF